jgi:alkylated DNA repair dioxygenase AlkB
VRRFEFTTDEVISDNTVNNNDAESDKNDDNKNENNFSGQNLHDLQTTKHGSSATASTTTIYPDLNQMTVNEYKRGEGIGSHVDTKSAFSDGLISVSLGADAVMEFKEQSIGTKKLVYLPPRSIILMSGPARYSWEHMIVSQGTDFANGKLIPRKTRTSLTLRTAITLPDTNSITRPLDLVESNKFPP